MNVDTNFRSGEMSSQKGWIAAVTGAGSGIGKAIAFKLAMDGAIVAMVDKSLPSLEAARKEAEGFRDRLIPIMADLEKDKDIQSLAANLVSDLKGISILVHCAGVFSSGDVETASVDDFDLQYRVNVRAAYILTQALLPTLKAQRGQVVFINSSSGLRAKAGTTGYSASKHALKAIADALREEVNQEGIRVTSVYPGRTATPMQSKISKSMGVPYIPEVLLKPEDVAQIVIDALKLNRTAEITDILVRPAAKND